jgi:hypothetical protein
MNSAIEIFLGSIDWLRSSYTQFQFFVERDIVWTVQTYLTDTIDRYGANFRVFNDYGILPGQRRRLSADLAIINDNGAIEVAAEFKYEPDHSRSDIPREKFPVVFWGKEGVEKDIARINSFVSCAGALHAYSMLIDEGGYFVQREPHLGSRWINWGGGRYILWSEVHRS